MARVIVEIEDDGCRHLYIEPYGDGSLGRCKVCTATDLPIASPAQLDGRIYRYHAALAVIADKGCDHASDGSYWCWGHLHAPPYCAACTAAMALAHLCQICGKPSEDDDLDDGAHSWCVRAATKHAD